MTNDYGSEHIPLVSDGPHSSYGGGEQTPRLIVLHAMGENIKDKSIFSAVEWLDHLELSAHALATPEGNIIRLRRDNEVAWHAKYFNIDSLGIEFLVPGVHDYGSFIEAMKTDWVTDSQFWAGVWQVKQWIDKWPITKIATHRELSPGRKFDPGTGFPLAQFLEACGWEPEEQV